MNFKKAIFYESNGQERDKSETQSSVDKRESVWRCPVFDSLQAHQIMKLFQRRIEDFVCGNCGFKVVGSGYTNHCPKCLYSKHVDVNPGDRLEICQGLMEPIGVEQSHGEYIILYKCTKCGAKRKNKSAEEDDINQIIKLTK